MRLSVDLVHSLAYLLPRENRVHSLKPELLQDLDRSLEVYGFSRTGEGSTPFESNPLSALTNCDSNWDREEYGEDLHRRFDRLLWCDLEYELESQLSHELHKYLTSELNDRGWLC